LTKFIKSVKIGIEGMHFNIIKTIYNKTIANIVLNGKILGTKQYLFFPLLLNIVLEFLAREIEVIQIRREEVKLSRFANDMILYLKDPKDSTNS
jgi:hypothetical protein